MTRSEESWRLVIARLAGMAALSILLVTAITARAQTFTVLHNFSGPDGQFPRAGLTMDQAGNLYGTTLMGGNIEGGECTSGCGTVFQLKHEGSGWILNPLYAFGAPPDGNFPQARVIIGPDGNLYGTTTSGGTVGYGTVFKLSPPPNACESALCPWRETVLHSFQGGSDGAMPQLGDLVFDQQGNLYGTTPYGGPGGAGVVYQLTPSGGGWTESILYQFGENGEQPFAGLIFDTAGNLYGVTALGGAHGGGTAYKMTPSGSGWTLSVIYNFAASGSVPYGGLIFDQAGNLYGTTTAAAGGTAMVYELTPTDGAWTLNQLYSFATGEESLAKLAMDASGRLYGTFFEGQEVFQLTLSDGQWTKTGFSGSAGSTEYGNVILDASGNVYGTAQDGGTDDDGVVFEITP